MDLSVLLSPWSCVPGSPGNCSMLPPPLKCRGHGGPTQLPPLAHHCVTHMILPGVLSYRWEQWKAQVYHPKAKTTSEDSRLSKDSSFLGKREGMLVPPSLPREIIRSSSLELPFPRWQQYAWTVSFACGSCPLGLWWEGVGSEEQTDISERMKGCEKKSAGLV